VLRRTRPDVTRVVARDAEETLASQDHERSRRRSRLLEGEQEAVGTVCECSASDERPREVGHRGRVDPLVSATEAGGGGLSHRWFFII
jgi:hypothetical protein